MLDRLALCMFWIHIVINCFDFVQGPLQNIKLSTGKKPIPELHEGVCSGGLAPRKQARLSHMLQVSLQPTLLTNHKLGASGKTIEAFWDHILL